MLFRQLLWPLQWVGKSPRPHSRLAYAQVLLSAAPRASHSLLVNPSRGRWGTCQNSCWTSCQRARQAIWTLALFARSLWDIYLAVPMKTWSRRTSLLALRYKRFFAYWKIWDLETQTREGSARDLALILVPQTPRLTTPCPVSNLTGDGETRVLQH